MCSLVIDLADGVEDAGGFGEGDLLAVQHLAEGGVVGDEDGVAASSREKWRLPISQPRRALSAGVARGISRTGSGRWADEVSGGILKEDGAIAEGLGEVEAEFAAILGGGVPAALCEGETVDGEEDLGEAARRRGQRGADDVHGGKFEIRNQKFELLGARGARREGGIDTSESVSNFEFRISNFSLGFKCKFKCKWGSAVRIGSSVAPGGGRRRVRSGVRGRRLLRCRSRGRLRSLGRVSFQRRSRLEMLRVFVTGTRRFWRWSFAMRP